jgi:hypothetical protein
MANETPRTSLAYVLAFIGGFVGANLAILFLIRLF